VAREKASSRANGATKESPAVKTIARRISKLEDRFATRRDQRGHTLADGFLALWERRRRRLAAEGHEPEEYPPFIDAGDRPWSLSERMRRRFQLRRLSITQQEG
jgi:hypothetical protein